MDGWIKMYYIIILNKQIKTELYKSTMQASVANCSGGWWRKAQHHELASFSGKKKIQAWVLTRLPGFPYKAIGIKKSNCFFLMHQAIPLRKYLLQHYIIFKFSYINSLIEGFHFQETQVVIGCFYHYLVGFCPFGTSQITFHSQSQWKVYLKE
jgi:hypothetical protein